MSKSLHEFTTTKLEEISKNVEEGGVEIVGVTTGFSTLDTSLGGLRKKAHYILGGRPGMGKTAFALSMLFAQGKLGIKNLLVSLEMDGTLIALRTLAMHTGIPSDRIERGHLSKEEFQAVKDVLVVVEKMPFRIIDEPLDSESFLAGIVKYQEKYGLDCLMVDYISLFRDENKFGDNERLSRISNNMVAIGKTCDIPVVSLAQLNREVEKRDNHVPILSDIRDSGSLEQDAFAVLFCYRPQYYETLFNGAPPVAVERDAKIIIAKNRQGETGQVTLNYHPAQTLWTPKDIIELKLPPSLGDNKKDDTSKSWVDMAKGGR